MENKNSAEATPIGDLKKDFKLIPLMDIEPLARQIAVKWVENYGNMGFDIENKHKLASDFMNYARLYHASIIKEKEGKSEGEWVNVMEEMPPMDKIVIGMNYMDKWECNVYWSGIDWFNEGDNDENSVPCYPSHWKFKASTTPPIEPSYPNKEYMNKNNIKHG